MTELAMTDRSHINFGWRQIGTRAVNWFIDKYGQAGARQNIDDVWNVKAADETRSLITEYSQLSPWNADTYGRSFETEGQSDESLTRLAAARNAAEQAALPRLEALRNFAEDDSATAPVFGPSKDDQVVQALASIQADIHAAVR